VSDQHPQAGEPTAAAFLDMLEKKGLVPGAVLATLRKQVAESKTPIAARRIAKLLVDKQVLTPAIAQRLLGGQGKPAAAAGTVPVSRPTAATSGPAAGPASLLDEELPPLPAGLPPLAGGSLDGLLSDPSLAAAADESSPLTPLAPAKQGLFAPLAQPLRRGGRRRARNMLWVWIAAGATALVVLIAVVVIAIVSRQDPETLLAPAEDDYQKGSFAKAVEEYDKFLDHFPRHAASGRARVRRGLAELRLKAAEPGGESAAAETAKRVVPAISAEAEFDAEAGPLVAAILPQLAEQLASQARSRLTSAAIAEAQEVLALGQRYIPPAEKPLERLGRIEASLALSRVKAAEDPQRSAAIAAIEQAAAAGDFAAAYRARATLLAAYPDLSWDAELTRAVGNIAAAEQAAVRWVAKTEPAAKLPPAEAPATPVLCQRQFTAAAPEAAGRVVFAAAGGAVYAMDAAEGKVLWRKFSGWNLSGLSSGGLPVPLTDQPGSDVIVAVAPRGDARREIQRVAAATGRLQWRQPIPAAFSAAPVVADDHVLLATLDGRLLTLDSTTGSVAGYVQLPQPLPLAPAVDPQHKLVFQLADHDNLFVLAMPGGRCLQVFPLGHEPGTISTPPALLGDCLVVAINGCGDSAALAVLKIRSAAPGSAAGPLSLAETISLKGHVDAPPSVADGRLLVATDAGAIHVFQPAAADAREPLAELCGARLGGSPGLTAFPLLRGDACFVADGHLTSLEIRAADKQLVPAWTAAAEGAAAQAPVAVGPTIFRVRHAAAAPGVVVSAVSAAGGTPYWQTSLAAPLAAEPLVDADGGKVTLAGALGGIFQLDAHDLGAAAAEAAPLASPGLHQPMTAATRCGGSLVLSGGAGSEEVLVADLAEPGRPPRMWCLPGPLSCPPVAFAGGLLAPAAAGQVHFLDPRSGRKLGEPFQPRLEAAALPQWTEPAVIGDHEVVISDGRGKLYRLDLVDRPAPHLAAATAVETAEPIVSPLASVGKMVCGVDASGKLDFFQLPGLARAGQQALPGRAAWGPRRVGSCVMLATDSGQLCCLDATGQLLWQAPLPYGPLVGSPLAAGDHYLLAAGSVVWRVDGKTGKELAKADAPGPLATGPVLLGNRLLLGGHDGSLYQLTPP
jgi:outer membrane protein assembly factor BamB